MGILKLNKFYDFIKTKNTTHVKYFASKNKKKKKVKSKKNLIEPSSKLKPIALLKLTKSSNIFSHIRNIFFLKPKKKFKRIVKKRRRNLRSLKLLKNQIVSLNLQRYSFKLHHIKYLVQKNIIKKRFLIKKNKI